MITLRWSLSFFSFSLFSYWLEQKHTLTENFIKNTYTEAVVAQLVKAVGCWLED